MSLKKFHIFFIAVSALLCLTLLGWGIWDFNFTREVFPLVLSGLGALGAVSLWFYLRWFLRKYPHLAVYALVAFLGSWLGKSSSALACAVCYQDPDSPTTKAAILGVWFLLVVIVGILLSVFLIGRAWVKRARTLGGAF